LVLVEMFQGYETNGAVPASDGFSRLSTAPKFGKSSSRGGTSPRFLGRRPVSMVCDAEPCELSPCVIDRMIEYLSATRASRGRCSVI
jgi:hypothetical protein